MSLDVVVLILAFALAGIASYTVYISMRLYQVLRLITQCQLDMTDYRKKLEHLLNRYACADVACPVREQVINRLRDEV